MLGRLTVIIVLLLFTLVACTNSQDEQGKEDSNPFLNLSTENEEENLEQPLDSPLNELIENQEQPEEPGETNDTEGTEETGEIEEIERNQEDQQQALPSEPEPTDERYGATQMEEEQFEVQTKLPFENFKERWNAVSDVYFSDLYIKEFKESQNDVGITHTATLSEQMELRVNTTGDYVQSIEIEAKGNVDITRMLTGWSQLINILHPELEIHDVDTLFHELGVGPNGDLRNLKEGTFPYNHISYTITRIENGYIFQGNYN